jgi:hypothetical protein
MQMTGSSHGLWPRYVLLGVLSLVGGKGCVLHGDFSLGSASPGADQAGGSGSTSNEPGAAGGVGSANGGAAAGSSPPSGGTGFLRGGSQPAEGGTEPVSGAPALDAPGGAGSGGENGATVDDEPTYLGCNYIGGVNRIVVSKRYEANDRCVNFVLSSPPDEPSTDPMLPDGWSFEHVLVGPAEECPGRWGTLVQATASGSITALDSNAGGWQPEHVSADVVLTFSPGQGLPVTDRLLVESVDVRPQCNAACQADSDCNDDPGDSSLHGRCTGARTCVCDAPYALNPATGRCL